MIKIIFSRRKRFYCKHKILFYRYSYIDPNSGSMLYKHVCDNCKKVIIKPKYNKLLKVLP